MPKFYVDMRIDFSGEIQAANEADAERLAWDSWGSEMGALISYDGVHDITVTELEKEEEEEGENN